MSLIAQRTKDSDDILKGIFIKNQLQEVAAEIDSAQTSLMASRGFNSSDFYNNREFSATVNALHYTHLAKHRFVDMRTRNTASGKIKKKNHAIHNRILFGHFNNIIKRLSFGYTQAVKDEMKSLAANLKNPSTN